MCLTSAILPNKSVRCLCCAGSRDIDIVLPFHEFVCNFAESIACYVDKFKLFLHAGGHSVQETCQFFVDIFLESCPVPSTHFLDVCVYISREGECVRAPTPERLCILPSDWNSFCCWVFKSCSSAFDGFAYIFVGDI